MEGKKRNARNGKRPGKDWKKHGKTERNQKKPEKTRRNQKKNRRPFGNSSESPKIVLKKSSESQQKVII